MKKNLAQDLKKTTAKKSAYLYPVQEEWLILAPLPSDSEMYAKNPLS